jgi:Na+/melibiose symporter-like transporter
MLRNRTFLHYFLIFGFFNIGFLAPQRILPHWAEVALGGDEGTVGLVLLPFIATSLLASLAAPLIARRLSSKTMMICSLALITLTLPWMYVIGAAEASYETKVRCGQILFGIAGLGNGLLYVLVFPLLGAIIDRHEAAHGERRDALFFALNNITWKAGIALSVILATMSLRFLGNSVSNPTGILMVGPIGALFSLIALIAAAFYPKHEYR